MEQFWKQLVFYSPSREVVSSILEQLRKEAAGREVEIPFTMVTADGAPVDVSASIAPDFAHVSSNGHDSANGHHPHFDGKHSETIEAGNAGFNNNGAEIKADPAQISLNGNRRHTLEGLEDGAVEIKASVNGSNGKLAAANGNKASLNGASLNGASLNGASVNGSNGKVDPAAEGLVQLIREELYGLLASLAASPRARAKNPIPVEEIFTRYFHHSLGIKDKGAMLELARDFDAWITAHAQRRYIATWGEIVRDREGLFLTEFLEKEENVPASKPFKATYHPRISRRK